jgi:two-component system CheB/CheR fusion protein
LTKKVPSGKGKTTRATVKHIPARKALVKKSKQDDTIPKPFPIVVFGASAGGIEAFTSILEHLAPDLGMAYVFILHLSPNHKSSLTEILQAKTKMDVHTVKDGMEIKANNIFVIPPNTFMSVVDGHLKLAPRALNAIGNYVIDYFLTGLASLYENNAIGVILSGSATDGTLGLKAIKAAGGITFAQDESAQFPGMPGNATEAGYVDFVLSPEKIAHELSALVKVPYTVLPSDTIEAVQSREINEHREELKKILLIVKNKTGVDFFLHYKQASIYRRVVRRMVLNKLERLRDYYTMIRTSPKEVEALYDDFLINVTNFFRDPDFYASLTKEIFPAIIKKMQVEESIRIWVAGCATGEEAYSVAITLIEFLEKKKIIVPVQIFASDLDANAIEKARLGIYPISALQGVSPYHLKTFFRKIDSQYQVVKPVREMCIFSQHNLLKDPPFSRLSLVSCQNVLIYLEPTPQKKILQTFHYALKSSGYLFLGKSETVGSAHDLFESLDKKVKVYSRKPTKSPQLDFVMHSSKTISAGDLELSQQANHSFDVEKDMDKIMLSRFVHPGVVLNENMIIIQFFGLTSQYLSPVAGKASLNILKMLRDDLVIETKSLLHEAKKTEKPITKEGIRIFTKKVLQEITIEVIPKRFSNDIFFLVVFKEQAPALLPENVLKTLKPDQLRGKAIAKLEEELARSREVIRTTTEEYETTYEELQANNEEILSANEELQSVNEELETSKEELQSANEELTTSNEESRRRNLELNESHTYAEAILETMHSPLLVLNANLQIRMANKAFYENFKLTPEYTEGAVLYELQENSWDIPVLREHLKELFSKTSNINKFEIHHTFPVIGKRVLIVHAYRFLKGENAKDTLLILAIDDITGLTNAEATLLKTQEQLKLSMIGDAIGTWSWIIPTDEVKWSKENEVLNGLEPGAFKGHYTDWEKMLHPADVESVKKSIRKSLDDKQPLEIEYRIFFPDGRVRWILSKGHTHYNEYGKPERMVGVSMDYSEKKMESESLESMVNLRTAELLKANKDLKTINAQLEQFAFVSSHNLQEPLRKITTFSNLLSGPEANLNAYSKQYSMKINASATRMSMLIKDLLSFTVLIKDDNKTFIDVDLNETLKYVIDDLETTIENKKATINVASLPRIHGDPMRMSQLFHNLISNALKFSEQNPVIAVSSRTVTPEDFRIYPDLLQDVVYQVIAVSDNGMGFDDKYAAQIFILFERLNDLKGSDGSGAGLAICKKIVEDHGGLIYAHGEKGIGATFTVFLPAKAS